ncbi:uncharacterized protein LOC134451587 [Engraulis encrasicolus]|uniref:uncharacterized protein LOC134451587 n=1 Tax=Engraulis encrasicolus TaxID=184585 RepID=UPI002FD5868C
MAVNDSCRLCLKNVRIDGIISNTKLLFDKGYCANVASQLAKLGLTIHNTPQRSYRVCRKCCAIIWRLLKDTQVLQRWKDQETAVVEETSLETNDAASSDDRRTEESTPSTPTTTAELPPPTSASETEILQGSQQLTSKPTRDAEECDTKAEHHSATQRKLCACGGPSGTQPPVLPIQPMVIPVNGRCRLCNDILRVNYTNSQLIFDKGHSNQKSLDKRLTKLGLELSNVQERSKRVCSKCIRLIEKVEAILRPWQKAEEELPLKSEPSSPTTQSSVSSMGGAAYGGNVSSPNSVRLELSSPPIQTPTLFVLNNQLYVQTTHSQTNQVCVSNPVVPSAPVFVSNPVVPSAPVFVSNPVIPPAPVFVSNPVIPSAPVCVSNRVIAPAPMPMVCVKSEKMEEDEQQCQVSLDKATQTHNPEWERVLRRALRAQESPMATTESSQNGARNSVLEVVLHYRSRCQSHVCADDDTSSLVEAIAKKNWNWAAKKIMRHTELLGPVTDNILVLIEEECKKLCNPDAGFMLAETSIEDLKAFSLQKLRTDLQRLAPYLLSIFLCISRKSENIACVAAAIALRGRDQHLAAFSHYVTNILLYGGVRRRVLNSITKFGITVSYTSVLRKRMELASSGEHLEPLKTTNKTFLNEDDDDDEDSRSANDGCVQGSENNVAEGTTRTSMPDVTVRDQSETMHVKISQSVDSVNNQDTMDSPMQSTHENPSGMEQTTGVNTPSQRDQELESNEDTDAPSNIHPTHLKGRPDVNQYLKDLVYKCPCCKFSTEYKHKFNFHMDFHINHAVPFKGYYICKCQMLCRLTRQTLLPTAVLSAEPHFHCLFCQLTIEMKQNFALHLMYCSMPPHPFPASIHNERPSNHNPLPCSAGATKDPPSPATPSGQRVMGHHMACQTDPPETTTVATQLSIETFKPHCKSRETQTSVVYSDACASTESETIERFPFDPYERPSKRPRLDLEEDPENLLDSSSLMDIGETVTILAESADLTTSHTPVQKMSTYIVYESCLRELFSECPDCKMKADVCTRRVGTFVMVQQHCQYCQHSRRWSSQPVLGSTPAGNLQLAAAIYINGASFTNTEKIFKTMNLKMLSYKTFQRHARMYIEPAIVHKWRTTQDGLLAELSQQHLIHLRGDMRTDFPGRTARFGSYTMMDLRNNKVIDIQLVERSEVGANESMETKGLGRSLTLLKDHDVRPDTVVTEARPEIEEFLSEATFTHYYDVRHVEKGLSKKLQTMSHKKFFLSLKKWFPTIREHLYWTAETSTTGPEREAKWRSLMYRVRNVHVHSDPRFPQDGLHTSRKRQRNPPQWLIDGSEALSELRKVLGTEKIVNDIWKLSPHPHTTSLEDFHTVSKGFAPKNVILPYQGRLCRLYLAALHFNENSGRPQATSADGEPLFRVAFPKSQTRECTDKPVMVEPTYRYEEELVDLVFDKVFTDPTPYVEEVLKIPRPPDVPSRFDQPCSQDVVSGYVSVINRGGRPPLY